MLSALDAEGHRDIEWCGIDVDLLDPDAGLELLKAELKRLGAPKGTILEYTLDGISCETDIHDASFLDMEH